MDSIVKHMWDSGFHILISHFDYSYCFHGLFTGYSGLLVPHLQGLSDSELGGRADL